MGGMAACGRECHKREDDKGGMTRKEEEGK